MRKFLIISLVAVFAVMTGTLFAQDDTTTTSTAWLGVAIVDNDGQVVITRVQSGSPADAADLLIGDVVITFNGEEVTSASQLGDLVQAAAVGDTVEVELLRNGESTTVEVTLAAVPMNNRRNNNNNGGMNLPQIDNVTLAETILNADLESADDGYEVVDTLTINNPFNLVEGDIVTAIGDVSIDELDLQTLVGAMQDGMTVTVTRDGEEMTLDASGPTLGGSGMFGMFSGRGFDFEMPNFDFDSGRGGGRGGRGNGNNAPVAPPNNSGASTSPVLPETGQA